MLEEAAHQHALVVRERRFGTVAVMHVEVDDRDALEPVHVERMPRRDRDVVEEAEAHRARRLRVMAGRPHAAERIVVAPSITASVAAIAAPAARSAARHVSRFISVSGSIST